MTSIEILSLVVTIVCLLSFCLVFTYLFRHYYLTSIDSISKGKDDKELLEIIQLEEKEEKQKRKRTLKITKKVLSYTFLALIGSFFVLSLYARIAGNNLLFGDSGLIVISSGSMSQRNAANKYLDEYNLNDQFNTYDIIGISKYKSQSQINLYDVVAFKGKDGNTYVHRIISLHGTEYETRGDSNAVSDTNSLYEGYLKYQDIIGYYNDTRLEVLGVFIIFLQSNSGIITVVSIIYCLLMFDHYKDKYDEAIEKRSKELITRLNLDSLAELDIEKEIKSRYIEEFIYKDKLYKYNDGIYIDEMEVSKEKLQEIEKEEKTVDEFIKLLEQEKDELKKKKLINRFKAWLNKDDKSPPSEEEILNNENGEDVALEKETTQDEEKE